MTDPFIEVIVRHGLEEIDEGLYERMCERGRISAMLLISGNVEVFRGERSVSGGYCTTPAQLDTILRRELSR